MIPEEYLKTRGNFQSTIVLTPIKFLTDYPCDILSLLRPMPLYKFLDKGYFFPWENPASKCMLG
jgi:hypothetical protein